MPPPRWLAIWLAERAALLALPAEVREHRERWKETEQ